MTTAAIDQLWKFYRDITVAEWAFWKTADDLLEQGLVRIEDVAVIYGCHSETARKRIKQAIGEK